VENGVSMTIPPTLTKEFGDLWFTNHRAYAANVYSPKMNSAHDFRQLYNSIANISGTVKQSTSRKRHYQLQSLARSKKKPGELWSTNKKVYTAKV